MGVPTSEVGYIPAMPRREDHEVHKGHVVVLDQKKVLHQELKKKINQSHYRPEVPGEFQEVKVHRLRDNGPGWW